MCIATKHKLTKGTNMQNLTKAQMLHVLSWVLTEQAEVCASEVQCANICTTSVTEWAQNSMYAASCLARVANSYITTTKQFVNMLNKLGVLAEVQALAEGNAADQAELAEYKTTLPAKYRAYTILINAGLYNYAE